MVVTNRFRFNLAPDPFQDIQSNFSCWIKFLMAWTRCQVADILLKCQPGQNFDPLPTLDSTCLWSLMEFKQFEKTFLRQTICPEWTRRFSFYSYKPMLVSICFKLTLYNFPLSPPKKIAQVFVEVIVYGVLVNSGWWKIGSIYVYL